MTSDIGTSSHGKLRVLVFTTLYPNSAQPSHGIFVENRLRELVSSGEVEAEVLAPVPIYPVAGRLMARYRNEKIPPNETRFGLRVHHPRYPLVPKLSMIAAPYVLFQCAKRYIESRQANGDALDIIDAHYFYPDGVAAALLGRHFQKPVVITGRGTDLNLIPDYYWTRRMILWAAERAAGLITVSAALKDRLVELGVAAERIRVLRNGVDLGTFRPLDRPRLRLDLGFKGPTLLSVGNLVPEKGHALTIGALSQLPEWQLVFVGAGPEEDALKMQARRLGVHERVRFLGRIAHDRLPELYSAADLLVLASSREGWPNVLLEAMACGTPVVAARVGGVPEIVADPAAGAMFTERTEAALVAAIRAVATRGCERHRTRDYAEKFGWEATTQGQLDLFRSIVG
jgi:glycosyltransferase involved in cell wall biosynthesis